jgi:uncharacterized protein (TIGR02001 family)
MKKSIVLTTAVAAALTSSVAAAEVTANAAFVSNYIWRGVTQTSDQAAGQGGIDWGHESGLYAGTWVSNVDFSVIEEDSGLYVLGKGYEIDFYAGFANEIGGLGYDVGVATYQYPANSADNNQAVGFTEAYVSATASIVTVGVNYTFDNAQGNEGGIYVDGDMYISGSLDFPMGTTDVSLYAGTYKFENDGKIIDGEVLVADYSNFGASIGKDGFTFAVDKNDIDDPYLDSVRVSVGYGLDFEL